MPRGTKWTRYELLAALHLYCRLPFGSIHSDNPEVIRYANAIGRSPSSLAMRLANIASIDPVITSSGRKGLPGGVSRDLRTLWDYMNGAWYAFVAESLQALDELGIVTESKSVPKEDEDNGSDNSGENYTIQTTARRGQDFFRSTLLSAYNQRCCITGLSAPRLLIASHIIPWHIDVQNRLNPRNGLLLSVLHDQAFDNGMITISNDYKLMVSPFALSTFAEDAFFSSTVIAYQGQSIRLPEKFMPDREFLAYHRKHIFQH